MLAAGLSTLGSGLEDLGMDKAVSSGWTERDSKEGGKTTMHGGRESSSMQAGMCMRENGGTTGLMVTEFTKAKTGDCTRGNGSMTSSTARE